MVETTIATTSDYEKKERTNSERLFKIAWLLLGHFPGLCARDIKDALELIRQEYAYKWKSVASLETASKAREDLLLLAEKANALMSTILSLGQGAVEAMALPVDEVYLGYEGDPFGLPCRKPDWDWPRDYKSSKEAFEQYGSDNDEYRGGSWVVRLHALSELANLQAKAIWERVGKGGRGASPIYRSRQAMRNWLAEECTTFASENGCNSQAVILEIMRTILELEHGKEVLYHRKEKTPSCNIGRKAVKRAIQLNNEYANS